MRDLFCNNCEYELGGLDVSTLDEDEYEKIVYNMECPVCGEPLWEAR